MVREQPDVAGRNGSRGRRWRPGPTVLVGHQPGAVRDRLSIHPDAFLGEFHPIAWERQHALEQRRNSPVTAPARGQIAALMRLLQRRMGRSGPGRPPRARHARFRPP